MRLRPAPTTTVAIAGVLTLATIPLREVFGSGRWIVGVVGAVIASTAVASALETVWPRMRLPTLAAVTAAGAVLWTIAVTLRATFWSRPWSLDAWRGLSDGVLDGWGALLDDQIPLTDPQPAEVFVACLVWVLAALAIHVAARGRTAVAAVAAGAVILAMSTAAVLPNGLPPAVIGAGAATAALLSVATITRAPEQRWRVGRVVALAGLIGSAALVAIALAFGIDSFDRTPADPRSTRAVDTVAVEVPDVLAEYGSRRVASGNVLTIESDAPTAGVRLRLQVYDDHDGERWIPSADFETLSTFREPEEIPPGDTVTFTVRLEDLDGPWIPVPDRVTEINIDDISWNEDAQTIISATRPAEYEVTGTLVSRADLEGLAGARDEVDEELSQPPPGLPDSIRQVAVEAAAGATDAITAIDAITERLRALGRDESRPPGNSFGRLRDDLDEGDSTGAEQIASLHALMLRAVGIPSRVVVGYVANGPEVGAGDLQVWVEAAFPGAGWVAIDAVPASTESGIDPSEEPTATTTTAPPSDEPLEARALPSELGPGEDPDEADVDTNVSLSGRALVLLGVMLVFALVLGLVAVRVIRRRLRRNGSTIAELPVLGAWAEFVDRLRELGAPVTATTTTGDVVYMATAIDETLGSHAESIAALTAEALHAPHGSHPDDGERAWEHLRLAEARITEVRGKSVIPRRYLDPRVLRYRAPLPPPSRNGGRRTVS